MVTEKDKNEIKEKIKENFLQRKRDNFSIEEAIYIACDSIENIEDLEEESLLDRRFKDCMLILSKLKLNKIYTVKDIEDILNDEYFSNKRIAQVCDYLHLKGYLRRVETPEDTYKKFMLDF